MTTNETYTVIDHQGRVIESGLPLSEAADVKLSYDGADWEIRLGDGIWELWTRKQVANLPWTKTVIISAADTEEEARAEIFEEVAGANWPCEPRIMPDRDYQQMMADAD